MKDGFDIAIIGGGINGQVLSLAAANAGFSVALIDKNKIVDDSLREFDGRAYAIAFSSVQMLKNLNLWNKIVKNANLYTILRLPTVLSKEVPLLL